jgi:anion-transporting  ArsA/GET3 family ATPase
LVQKLQDEAALMNRVYLKHLQQAKETGEAQEATKIRDKALDELAVYVSNLWAIVKVALSDSPQQLEKLGILARSGGASPRKPSNPMES